MQQMISCRTSSRTEPYSSLNNKVTAILKPQSFKWVNFITSSFKLPSRERAKKKGFTEEKEQPIFVIRSASVHALILTWSDLPQSLHVRIPPIFQAGVTSSSPKGSQPWLHINITWKYIKVSLSRAHPRASKWERSLLMFYGSSVPFLFKKDKTKQKQHKQKKSEASIFSNTLHFPATNQFLSP